MSEKIAPGPVGGNACFREAVCIHTTKVYDSCKNKECIRDLRVYLTADSQAFINNNCVTVRPRTAELLYVNINVEKVQYNRGFYSVDIRYFYRIVVEASTAVGRPILLDGLAVFDKRCILFGGEGGARIFSSRYVPDAPDQQLRERTNLPTAVVETVDPILLDAKIVEPNYCCGCGCEINNVPSCICGCFGGEELALNCDGNRLFVTLGQFAILRLERDIQLLIPAYDICMPERDCNCSGAGGDTDVDPCDVFDRFEFPIDEFFPPRHPCGDIGGAGCGTGCGGNSCGGNSCCGSPSSCSGKGKC